MKESITIQGLSQAEAQRRLKKDGPNQISQTKKRTIFHIVIDVLREPMLLFLLITGGLYLIMGEKSESLLLITFVWVVIGITLYQEGRTENALAKLRDLASPQALVFRDGKQVRIPGVEVVRGDLIFLEEGERVPADSALVKVEELEVDESILTGESIHVKKSLWDKQMKLCRPGGDGLPFVYGGTIITHGYAMAEVVATGVNTEIGRIGKSLVTIKSTDSHLQNQLKSVVFKMTIIGMVVCLAVIIFYGISKGQWLNGVLSGLALAMALLPEELPVILTVFLALGAWRIGKNHVLTRKVAAVEALGSVTVMCVDKTGTLTMNELGVKRLTSPHDEQVFDHKIDHALEIEEFSPSISQLAKSALLACRPEHPDPLEKAVRQSFNLEHKYQLVKIYPLTSKRLVRIMYWQSGDENIAAAMGSPEAVAELCNLSEHEVEKMHATLANITTEGLRVVAIAQAILFKNYDEKDIDIYNQDYQFAGLISFSDPIRPEVKSAIDECKTAGIKVVMITGDYKETALSIAKQIDLSVAGVMTGKELAEISDPDLKEKISEINIFARIMPEQKLRIVEAFKSNGEVVVMTGDGVNDAPALKAAHVGIAMGERGTDVAREAASLVLVKDSFTSIVSAVRSGRRIFDNLQKAILYAIAVHVPIAGLPILGIVFNWPLILLPAHIAFLELIIDPACSIVYEAELEESNIMNRPPRPKHQKVFDQKTLLISLVQGLVVLIATAILYIWSVKNGHTEETSRTLAFLGMVFGNLSMILVNRSRSGNLSDLLKFNNPYLLWSIFGNLAILGLIMGFPYTRDLFHFAPLKFDEILISSLVGVATFIILGLTVFNMWRKTKIT